MNEQQKKEILESDNFNDYCSDNIKCANCAIGYAKDCSAEFYKIKFKAEKAKVEKLKKCVEFYASLEHNSEAQSLEYDDPSFFINSDDISTEVWKGKDHNGVERSHKGRYYGKHAREVLKEIGE